MEKLVDKNLIKGIFLLVLAVCGNFVAETLGCKTQKLLTENMWAKQVVILMIIYFSINLTGDGETNPSINLAKALLVWTAFLIFNKMSLPFTVIVFLLLMVVYVMDTYIEYYKKQEEDTEKLENAQTFTYYLIIGLTILGFIMYFTKQYADYGGKDWSTATFLFGKPTCAGLK